MPLLPFFVSFLVALLTASGPLPATAALDHPYHRVGHATPSAVTFPVTPDPAMCPAEPRSAKSLRAILGPALTDSASADGTRADVAAVTEVPVGQPAGAETRAAVTATLVEFYACFNAGDFQRAFALVTDEFLARFAAEESLIAEDLAFFTATPTPVPREARTTLLAITDISILPDGRVGAFIITDDALIGPDTAYIILRQQGSRWLVDESIEFL